MHCVEWPDKALRGMHVRTPSHWGLLLLKRSKRGRSSRTRIYDPLLPKQMRYQAALYSEIVVPPAGLEPARLAAVDFESTVSAFPPEGHLCMVSVFKKHT